jgi:hypothetical protein
MALLLSSMKAILIAQLVVFRRLQSDAGHLSEARPAAFKPTRIHLVCIERRTDGHAD